MTSESVTESKCKCIYVNVKLINSGRHMFFNSLYFNVLGSSRVIVADGTTSDLQ